MTVKVKKFSTPLTLSPQPISEKVTSLDDKWSISPNGFDIRLPMRLTAMWKVVKVSEDCPWRIYRSKVGLMY